VLDNYTQNRLPNLIYLLAHGNPERLNKFVKTHDLFIGDLLGKYIYCYVIDKADYANLMWLANFAGISLKSNNQDSDDAVQYSFVSTVIRKQMPYQPNYPLMIRNLKKIGFNLNQQYEKGSTILHYAAWLDVPDNKLHQDLLRALLDNGADPNIKNDYNQAALKYANNEEIANYLIQQPECKPAFKHSKNNKSVEIKATEFKNRETYAYCLQHGGVESAISRIERELIANTIPVARNSSMNNPAPRRI
jgi:hypothetical protein